MPTFPKLVAAVSLAILAYFASELIKTLLPDSTDFGYFVLVNAVIGLLMGWFVIGGRAGRGFAAGISNGFTGVVALIFWGLFVQSANEMTRLAMRNRYSGPVEALSDIFQIMADYGATMLDIRVISLFLIGAVVVGTITEIAAKRRA